MDTTLRIAVVEPFYTGSHKTWVDDLVKFLPHEVNTFTLPGRHWKWRMSAGSIELASQVNDCRFDFDLFVVTDMLDLSTFKSLLSDQHSNTPCVIYMHENQIVYPYQTKEEHKNWDKHYGLINYKSILCANEVWFNSSFHLAVFTQELERFLSIMPESKFHLNQVRQRVSKFSVLPIAIDFELADTCKQSKSVRPTVLWNHRWEFDKNPELFFETLVRLSEENVDFDLIVAGENYRQSPAIFDEAKDKLRDHITHWGFFKDKTAYYKALWSATILPVTNNQEFFGISVMEAIYCGVMPLLPARLSYTDLYEGLNVFYDNNEDFYSQLKTALVNNERTDYSTHVQYFSWKNMKTVYSEKMIKSLT